MSRSPPSKDSADAFVTVTTTLRCGASGNIVCSSFAVEEVPDGSEWRCKGTSQLLQSERMLSRTEECTDALSINVSANRGPNANVATTVHHMWSGYGLRMCAGLLVPCQCTKLNPDKDSQGKTFLHGSISLTMGRCKTETQHFNVADTCMAVL